MRQRPPWPWERGAAVRVWSALETDPVFVAGMERARADFAAGRAARWRAAVERLDRCRKDPDGRYMVQA